MIRKAGGLEDLHLHVEAERLFLRRFAMDTGVRAVSGSKNIGSEGDQRVD
jgi:hypothetical protein